MIFEDILKVKATSKLLIIILYFDFAAKLRIKNRKTKKNIKNLCSFYAAGCKRPYSR